MYITFADGSTSEALQVLSEGHIKILGLSILLAKAVHDNLNFIIFDDIVNAIDDDHRNGVADLLQIYRLYCPHTETNSFLNCKIS